MAVVTQGVVDTNTAVIEVLGELTGPEPVAEEPIVDLPTAVARCVGHFLCHLQRSNLRQEARGVGPRVPPYYNNVATTT